MLGREGIASPEPFQCAFKRVTTAAYSILFNSILYYVIFLHSIIYSILSLHSILYYIPLHTIINSVLVDNTIHSILLYSIIFNNAMFNSIVFCSFLFPLHNNTITFRKQFLHWMWYCVQWSQYNYLWHVTRASAKSLPHSPLPSLHLGHKIAAFF